MNLSFRALVATLFLTACAIVSSTPSSSSPVADSTDRQPAETQDKTSTPRWRITPGTQSLKYSTSITTVTTQPDVAVIRHDTLITQSSYSIGTKRSADTLSFSGVITAFTIRANTSDEERPEISVPALFAGYLTNHSIAVKVSSTNQGQELQLCDNPAQSLFRNVQRSLFLIPFEITQNQTWTDSTSSIVCLGALPVTTVVTRTFRLTGSSELEGNSVLVIEGSEKTFSKGEGSQGQHLIILEATGVTASQYYLDQTSGELLRSSSNNSTSVLIRSSGRTQHFIQNSTAITQRTN